MTRKICVVTGSRADYGLLCWLMKEVQADARLQLQVVATGMHMSPEFGLTYKDIEADGFQTFNLIPSAWWISSTLCGVLLIVLYARVRRLSQSD